MAEDKLIDLIILTKIGIVYNHKRKDFVHKINFLPPSSAPSLSTPFSSTPTTPERVPEQSTIITNQMLMDQFLRMQGFMTNMRSEMTTRFPNVHNEMKDICYMIEHLKGFSRKKNFDEDIDE